MSTGTVLDEITGRAEQIGLSVGWVETTFDVDEDLEHLRRIVAARADLAATRSALEALGLYGDGRRTSNEYAETPPIDAGPVTGPTSPGHKKESR